MNVRLKFGNATGDQLSSSDHAQMAARVAGIDPTAAAGRVHRVAGAASTYAHRNTTPESVLV